MICVECFRGEVRSKPGPLRASVFAGGWKGGLDYARLSAGLLCFSVFEEKGLLLIVVWLAEQHPPILSVIATVWYLDLYRFQTLR